jgi:hypothetical protein
LLDTAIGGGLGMCKKRDPLCLDTVGFVYCIVVYMSEKKRVNFLQSNIHSLLSKPFTLAWCDLPFNMSIMNSKTCICVYRN